MVSIPRSGDTFLPFFYFVSMAIFSPINVAKVKSIREEERAERSDRKAS